MRKSTNSRVSRVLPVFQWLGEQGGPHWPRQLLHLAEGMESPTACGSVISVEAEKERKIPASPARLAWMIRNVGALAPLDGTRWKELLRRVNQYPDEEVAEVLGQLATEWPALNDLLDLAH